MRSTTSTASGERPRRAVDPTERASGRDLTWGAAKRWRPIAWCGCWRGRLSRPFRLPAPTGPPSVVRPPELMRAAPPKIVRNLPAPARLSLAPRHELEIALGHIVQVEEVPLQS